MQDLRDLFENLLRLMGFGDFSISVSEESRRLSVFINEGPYLDRYVPTLVADFEFILRLVAHKTKQPPVFIDVNNYRKNREDLIIKLAKAAAKKTSSEKKVVALPPMNAYERRLIHAELATHPDVKTESEGEGKGRHVVIRPME